MSAGLVLQLCGATLVAAVGVMLVVVGSLVVGGLVALGGTAWLVRCLRSV